MKRLLLALSLALPLLASAQQLTVSAAASLTDAFKEIGPKFEAAKPGSSVRPRPEMRWSGAALRRLPGLAMVAMRPFIR